MIRSTKNWFGAVALAGGLLIATASYGAAPPAGPFAAGTGKAAARSFEFSATKAPGTGSVRGSATFRWTARPRGTVEIEVTCLAFDGQMASVGGRIHRRTGTRIARSARSGVFVVQDRQATSQADRIGSLRLSRARAAKCSAPSSERLTALRSGDIAIDDAKP